MELKQIAPWNWFRSEQETEGKRLPMVRRSNDAYPAPLARFYSEFDQLFENFLRGFPMTTPMFPNTLHAMEHDEWVRPSVDIMATDQAYTISAELPGVDEKHIDVEIAGDTLVIRGNKEHRNEEKTDDYYCVERSCGSFLRRLSLPQDADSERIQAEYKAGVLTLTVPRKPGRSMATKQIDVKVA
jgi:HSP20 family protein